MHPYSINCSCVSCARHREMIFKNTQKQKNKNMYMTIITFSDGIQQIYDYRTETSGEAIQKALEGINHAWLPKVISVTAVAITA